MDCNNRLHTNLEKEDFDRLEKETGKPLIPLTDSQYEELKPLGSTRRKNYMRNQPCVCGSKKKFKKCCWSKFR